MFIARVGAIHRLNRPCVLQAVDAGDSMFVHVFGAYFGLAVSYVFGAKREPKEHELEGASYNSDIFAMIGKCEERLSSFRERLMRAQWPVGRDTFGFPCERISRENRKSRQRWPRFPVPPPPPPPLLVATIFSVNFPCFSF